MSDSIRLIVDNTPVDVQILISNGRSLVPLRAVAELLGAKVVWEESTQTVQITGESKGIILPLGSMTATVDGRTTALEAPALVYRGRTYVPLRFIAEAMGVKVEWHEATQSILIGDSDPPVSTWVPRQRSILVEGQRSGFALGTDGFWRGWGAIWGWEPAHYVYTPAILDLRGVVAVASATYHNLALKADGTVWAFDQKGETQFSHLTEIDYLTVSVPLRYRGLAIRRDGTVWEFDPNDPAKAPVQITGLSDAVKVVAQGDGKQSHSMALKADGTVWAWGNGLLGNGKASLNSGPVQARGLDGVVDIAIMGKASYAVKQDGTVWWWGDHRMDGPILVPEQIDGLSEVIQVAAGEAHTLFLHRDGLVSSHGTNYQGQLGNGKGGAPSWKIVRVLGLENVVHIAAGGDHSMAVTRDGKVWAWGNNNLGALGLGNATYVNLPVEVNGLEVRLR